MHFKPQSNSVEPSYGPTGSVVPNLPSGSALRRSIKMERVSPPPEEDHYENVYVPNQSM